MNKYNPGNKVRILSLGKYFEMFGVVVSVIGGIDNEWYYGVDIYSSISEGTKVFKESELELTNKNEINTLIKINRIVREYGREYPGIGTVVYEEYINTGFIIDSGDYYIERFFSENVRNGLPVWRGEIYNFARLVSEHELKSTIESAYPVIKKVRSIRE